MEQKMLFSEAHRLTVYIGEERVLLCICRLR
jgi:hypothetical protein